MNAFVNMGGIEKIKQDKIREIQDDPTLSGFEKKMKIDQYKKDFHNKIKIPGLVILALLSATIILIFLPIFL